MASFSADPNAFAGKVQVPTLLLAGTLDTYKACCMIQKAPELDRAANAGSGPRRLEARAYPGADHGLSTDSSKRGDVMSDACTARPNISAVT